MIGIYKITNLINQKVYIGQSINIEKRWQDHCATVDNCAIHRAIQKYGKENFVFEILEECDLSMLNEKEIYYIEKYNSYYDGYNMTLGGEGASHPIKLSDDQIEQIKILLKENRFSISEIAIMFSVSRHTISDINLGKSRRKDNEKYPIRPTKYKILEKEKLLEELQQTKGDFSQIGKNYNVSEMTIRNWCKKYNLSTKRKDYGFIDKQSYHSYSIICYDKNWNIIAEYDSIRQAIKAIGKGSSSGLSVALRKGQKEYAGYFWKYKDI